VPPHGFVQEPVPERPERLAVVICHPPSAICHPPFVICHPPSAICHLPSAICHLPSAIRHLSSAIRHPPFVICHPPSAICHPPFVIRHPPFVICHFSFPIPRSEFRIPHFLESGTGYPISGTKETWLAPFGSAPFDPGWPLSTLFLDTAALTASSFSSFHWPLATDHWPLFSRHSPLKPPPAGTVSGDSNSPKQLGMVFPELQSHRHPCADKPPSLSQLAARRRQM
jgi:hypothetical protein